MSNTRTDDPSRIRRYLLGELSEDEAEELESRYFAEPELFELVDAMRDELCDDHVRGRLSERDRAYVQSLASSPEWGKRLRFAGVLARELPSGTSRSASRTVPAPANRGRMRFGDVLRFIWAQPGSLRFATVFAMIVLASGWPVSWLGSRARVRLEEARTTSEQQLASARQALETERQRSARLEQTVAGQSTVDFSLFEGMTRGGGESLVVSAAASFVRLQLGTEQTPRQGKLAAVMRSADGSVVWSNPVDSIAIGGGSTPVVRIPAPLLASGEYDLQLLDVGDATRAREVARFHFRIVRR